MAPPFYTELHQVGLPKTLRPTATRPDRIDDIALVHEHERLLMAGVRSEAHRMADTVTHTSQVCV